MCAPGAVCVPGVAGVELVLCVRRVQGVWCKRSPGRVGSQIGAARPAPGRSVAVAVAAKMSVREVLGCDGVVV